MNTDPSNRYRLLGVDPGTNLLGFAVIEVAGQNMQLLELGVIHLQKFNSQAMKLRRIFERLQAIIETHQPSAMAIEAPFFGKNPQSMLKLGRAQGVAIAAGITKGLEVTEYSPKKIKQSVTGKGNASKEQVAAMLGHLIDFNPEGHYFDATDALATAICHYYQSRHPLGNQRRYNDWASFLKDHPDRKG